MVWGTITHMLGSVTQINPCKSNEGRFVTRMKTLLRASLIYKRPARLPLCASHNSAIFVRDGRGGWGQSTDTAQRLIIVAGFEQSSSWDPSIKKRKILITFIFRPCTINWSRAFSLPLNEATLCLEIVSFNCLYQLQPGSWSFFYRRRKLDREKSRTTYTLWWRMCKCPPLYVCV